MPKPLPLTLMHLRIAFGSATPEGEPGRTASG